MKRRTVLYSIVVLVIITIVPTLNAQTNIWQERFDYPNGTTQGSGIPPRWTISYSGSGSFAVDGFNMVGRDLDVEAVWTSQIIDISSYVNVSITIPGAEQGNLEASDFIGFYYRLDGGPEIVFPTNGLLNGNFTFAIASVSGINGSNLVIVVRVLNDEIGERIVFDDVQVQGTYQPPPQISIDDETENESVGTMTFTVSLSAASASNVSVDYQTANGTAVAPGDYTSASGTAVIAAGNTSTTINIPIIDDLLDENDEVFTINLSNPVKATIGDGQGTGTIQDNDDPPTLSISDESVDESAGVMTFTVSLSAASSKPISVLYQSADGTAHSPGDYLGPSGAVTIYAGNVSATFNVQINEDALDENDETFTVGLFNPVNATIADGQGTGTILDNDAPPALSINDRTDFETNGMMMFTITLSAVSGRNVSVGYQTANGTAIAPGDYTATSGTATILAGNTSTTIYIPINDDMIDETDETFTVNLINPVNATIADAQGQGVIQDDDYPPYVGISDEIENESVGTMTFTVSLAIASGKDITIDYQTANGTAVAPGDYTSTSGTVSILAGNMTATFDVPIIDDPMDENTENFLVNLSNPVNATLADGQGQGVIEDNDDPPTISISDETEKEGAGTMSFTVTLSAASSQPISMLYLTTNGTAAEPGDYTSTYGVLNIPVGNASATINVPIIDDLLDEPDETFTVDLSNPVNATISDGQGQGTIQDNDDPPTISISDETEDEGVGTMSFTVTLSATSSQQISVLYQTMDGTAAAPGDYTSTSGTLNIQAGNTSATINVPIIDDLLDENDENFVVRLSNPVNVTISDGSGQGTIQDNDDPPTISISDETEDESIGTMTFTVSLSAASGKVVSVDYHTLDAIAVAPGDYTSTSGTLNIPAGNTSANISVPIIDDLLDEPDNEDFVVRLSDPVNASIADGSGRGTIHDNDDPPTISISDETEDEGVGTMSFTVTLSAASSWPISMLYQTTNGSAAAPGDYINTNGTLNIPAGNTSATINVPIVDDLLDEPDETFRVNLNNPLNATISDGQGQGTIRDNDAPPTISISDETEDEGVGIMTFTLTLSAPSSFGIHVNYSIRNNSAWNGQDYTAPENGVILFAPGQTSRTLDVTIIDDLLDENDETFRVGLWMPNNATIADGEGIGTILDNDDPPTISISDETENEGVGTMSFTVTLSAASSKSISVQYQTVDGTALDPGDYTSTSGTLNIPAGNTSAMIDVPIIDDLMDESDEDFVVRLSNPVNATISDGSGQATIQDNDDPPTISISDETENEGVGTMSFTMTLSAASSQPIAVFYQTVDGTAGAPGDYTSTSATLTIPPGHTSATINVPIIDDLLDEPNETFTVDLSSPVNATISDGSGQATIQDNDDPPTISISDETENEGVGTMSFTVTLSAASSKPISVLYETMNGSAVSPGDYTSTSGTLDIPAWYTSTTINIPIIDDLLDEPDEDFVVRLNNPVNATINDGSGQGTIQDNDDPPTISISDETENEGVGTMSFTVTLSAASSKPISVFYQTVDGTAGAPGDYTGTSATLTIPAGNTSATIHVPIIDDLLDEPDETFTVDLSSPLNATIADGIGHGTIQDNDDPARISINDVSADEGIGTMTFTVTLSAASGMNVSVDYQASNGTAVAPGDYTSVSGTLTIPAGSMSATIDVPINDDATYEPDETFFIDLSNAQNGSIADGQGQGTILNNDPEPGTIIVEKQTEPAGHPTLFTFSGDASGQIGDNGQIVVSDIPPGTYTSTEAIPIGWELVSIAFTDDNSTYDLNTGTATFHLDPGETVKATFTNRLTSTTISAEKDAEAELHREWNWTIDKSAYPETWNLFTGDVGVSKYTVIVTKNLASEVVTISGQVCVTNTGDVATTGLTIYDHIQYRTTGMTTWAEVPDASQTTTPSQLAPDESKCYDYSLTFDAIADAEYRNVALVTITNYLGHAGAAYGTEVIEEVDLPTTPTTEVNGTVHVDDSNGRSWETSQSATWTYTKAYQCGDDAGENSNTAVIRETQQSAEASVDIICYELDVSKDVLPTFNRYYNWTIDKTADQAEMDLRGCVEGTINYAVKVEDTHIDRDYAVSGKITVYNSAPIQAVINSIADILPDATGMVVDCSVSFPYTLLAGQAMECSYRADLPDNTARTNRVVARMQNFTYAQAPEQPVVKDPIGETEFSGEAAVAFGEIPINVIDESVLVTDTNQPDSLGTVTAAEAPKSFAYAKAVGPYYTSGDYKIENTAKYVTNDTQTEGSDDWSVTIHVKCPVPVAEFNATPTQGISPLEVQFEDLSTDAAKWLWEFGDGTTSEEQHPVHIYHNPPHKYYTVKLTVWDCCEEHEVSVTKENFVTVFRAAQSYFNGAPIALVPGSSVQFDNQCEGLVNHFVWNYGDGKKEEFMSEVQKAVDPVHIYDKVGEYTVSLKAWGQGGDDEMIVPGMIYVDKYYQALEFIDGSEIADPGKGWEKAIDHDIISPNSCVLAHNDSAWAIFKLDTTKSLHKLRLMTNTALKNTLPNHLMKDFEFWTSTDGENYTLALQDSFVDKSGWGVYELTPVEARFVKLLVLSAHGDESPYVSLCEMQLFGKDLLSIVAGASAASSTLISLDIPEEFGLSQNYPNPFNLGTAIRFQLPEQADVILEIYNIRGQRVIKLIQGQRCAGYHQMQWNGVDESGNIVNSGLYFYRLHAKSEANTFVEIKKMTLIK
ncbi:PKD domain-containing protein [candidate division KSB1 bacterium]|nr:PKD domain-containing protein [candidate division KSB1 bacterium]